MSLVSVIIPTYNQPKWLAEAIQSVKQQTYPNWELIVVDDGSTDDTAEVCKQFPFCRYIQQQNAGVSAARNTGMSIATGEYIAFLDHDDRWLPHKLANQVAYMRSKPEVILTYTGINWFDDVTGNVWGTYLPLEVLDAHQLLHNCFIPNSSSMIRSSVSSLIGPWDVRYPLVQDRDYFLRAALVGAVGGLSEILTEIRSHDTHLSGNKDRWFHEVNHLHQKHRQMHKDCADCDRVFHEAYIGVRHLYAEALKQNAREALAQGKMKSLCWFMMKSLWFDPKPVLKRLGLSR